LLWADSLLLKLTNYPHNYPQNLWTTIFYERIENVPLYFRRQLDYIAFLGGGGAGGDLVVDD
jgi:hypothetical protein